MDKLQPRRIAEFWEEHAKRTEETVPSTSPVSPSRTRPILSFDVNSEPRHSTRRPISTGKPPTFPPRASGQTVVRHVVEEVISENDAARFSPLSSFTSETSVRSPGSSASPDKPDCDTFRRYREPYAKARLAELHAEMALLDFKIQQLEDKVSNLEDNIA